MTEIPPETSPLPAKALHDDPDEGARVPLFGTWGRAYLFVVVFFVLQVVAYTLLTRAAS